MSGAGRENGRGSLTRDNLVRGLVWLKYKLLGRYHPFNPNGAAPPRLTYAQAGEDCIIYLALYLLGIHKPSYLDIGAHHPTSLSNTYFFYRRGCRGVCVEPDPKYARLFRRKRHRDTFLPVAVSIGQETEADFYLMKQHALNTLSRESALALERSGEEIARIVRIKLRSVNDILIQHLPNGPNFVSLDAEGVDLEILQSFDFGRFRPQVFCVETSSFDTQEKTSAISEFMSAQDYMVFGETRINTIYVDRLAWSRRRLRDE